MKRHIRHLAALLLALLLTASVSVCGFAEQTPDQWTDIRQIVAGYDFVIGLCGDGSVRYFGNAEAEVSRAGTWTGVRELIVMDTGGSVLAGLREDGTVVTTSGLDLSSWKQIRKMIGYSSYSNCWAAGLKEDGTIVTAHSDVIPEEDPYLSYDWLDAFPKGDYTDLYLYRGWTAMSGIGAIRSDGTVACADNSGGVLAETAGWNGIVSLCSTLDGFYGLRSDGTVACPESAQWLEYGTAPESWSEIQSLHSGYQDDIYGITRDGRIVGAVTMQESAQSLEQAQNWENVRDILHTGWNDVIAADRNGNLLLAGNPEISAESDLSVITQWKDVRELILGWGNYPVAALCGDGTVKILK